MNSMIEAGAADLGSDLNSRVGFDGPPGATGAQGPKGDKGDTGPAGPLVDGLQRFLGNLGGGIDLNTLTETGWWHQGNNSSAASGTNYPIPRAGRLVIHSPYATFVYQSYHVYSSQDVYVRAYYNGTWGTWGKQAVEDRVVLNNGSPWTPHANSNRNSNYNYFATDYGYIGIGPANSIWAHFVTDRPKFHFARDVAVQGEIYAGSSYNQQVWHAGNFSPDTKLDTTDTAANSTRLNGQLASFYTNAANLSGTFGLIQSSSSIVATGYVWSKNGTYYGADTFATLCPNVAGIIYLRPNGNGSSSGQATLSTAGDFTASGRLFAGAARLNTDGDLNGTAWSGWFSTYLNGNFAKISNVPAYIAATSAGAIGSYVFAATVSGQTASFGGTVSGSYLRPSNSSDAGAGAALSGSWRCLGHLPNAATSTLWLRYA